MLTQRNYMRRLDIYGKENHMKKRIVEKIKDIVLTIVTAIATVQMIVAVAMFGQNNWDATWLPIQIGMFLLGVTWDVMFLMANFPTFERK